MTISFVDMSAFDAETANTWVPKDGVAFRALGYGRVSDEGAAHAGGTAKSNREQHGNFDRKCARNGWVAEWFFDEGARSGSRNRHKRVEFNEAVAVIKSGVVDVVDVWSSSRSARDVETVVTELLPVLRKTGTRYSYGTRVYNPHDANDREAIIIDALRDEAYAKRISTDVKRSTFDRARVGAPHGRPPYGYRRVTIDTDEGAQPANVIVPADAAVVRETVAKFLAGVSLRSMVDGLNATHPLPVTTVKAGRNTGRVVDTGWTRTRVRDMVANPAYAGLRVFRGQLVGTGTWEPLITVADHEAVIARLAHTATAKTRGNRRQHLLSGVALCGCGGGHTMAAGFVQQSSGAKYPTYTCPKGRIVVSEADADAFVIGVLCDGIAREYRRIDPTKAADAADIDDARAALVLKVNAWTDAMFNGTMPEATATNFINRAHAEIAKLDVQRDKLAAARSMSTAAADVANADDPYAAFESLTLEQRVDVLRSFLRVTVNKSTAKAGTFDGRRIVTEWLGDDGTVAVAA